MGFQQTVLTISIVIFVILMLFIGIMIYRAKQTTKFPPQVTKCPDYWIIDKDGNCSNPRKLGSGCAEGTNFPKMNSLAEKCNFAKTCGIEWDGITNSADCQ